jgi:hypothetical protein
VYRTVYIVQAVLREATPYSRILIIFPFFAAHALRRTPTTDRQVILDLLAACDSALAPNSLKDTYLSSAELANAELALCRVKLATPRTSTLHASCLLIIILGRRSTPATLSN